MPESVAPAARVKVEQLEKNDMREGTRGMHPLGTGTLATFVWPGGWFLRSEVGQA